MSRKLLILLSGTIVFLFSVSDVASAAELMALINVSDQTMVIKKTARRFITGKFQLAVKVMPHQAEHSVLYGCIKCGTAANMTMHRCPMQFFITKAMRSTAHPL